VEGEREILVELGPNGKLFAFDQDEDALANTIADDVLLN
jgi:16S rRNA (cytosine1402-N4)-methyltransferase